MPAELEPGLAPGARLPSTFAHGGIGSVTIDGHLLATACDELLGICLSGCLQCAKSGSHRLRKFDYVVGGTTALVWAALGIVALTRAASSTQSNVSTVGLVLPMLMVAAGIGMSLGMAQALKLYLVAGLFSGVIFGYGATIDPANQQLLWGISIFTLGGACYAFARRKDLDSLGRSYHPHTAKAPRIVVDPQWTAQAIPDANNSFAWSEPEHPASQSDVPANETSCASATAERTPEQRPSHPRNVDSIEALERLANLRKSGALTEEEFVHLKRQVLE